MWAGRGGSYPSLICAAGIAFAQIAFAQPEVVDPPTDAATSSAAAAIAQDALFDGERFGAVLQGVQDVLDAIDELPPRELGVPLPEDALVLTARESVARALADNPVVGSTAADVEAAQARTGQAFASRLPQVSVGSAYQYLEGADDNFGGGFLSDIVVPGSSDIKEIQRADRLTIDQLLFAGGSTRAAVRASRYLAESEAWRREATLDQLEFDTKQAYYDGITARALVQVAQDAVSVFESHREDTQVMLDVGDVARLEVLRAETELGSRQADVVEADNVERIVFTNLRRLLALPPDTPLLLVDRIRWQELNPDPNELIALAVEQRPEARALRAAIAAAQQDIERVKGTYWPRAAATAEWTNLDGAGGFVRDGWAVTIGADWEVFAGRRRKFEKVEARAQRSSLEHQLADITRLIEADVYRAYTQVENAIATIRRERGNVDLAHEGLRLAQLSFREGVGTPAEVLDAQLALTNAQTQLVIALRDYAVAHAALDQATGRSWVRETAPDIGPEEGEPSSHDVLQTDPAP